MNKLIRKLTLSGVTLGVAALSLTTSTYAWFTTNTTATASGISGSVKASGGNMLIKTLNYWEGDVVNNPTTTTADTWSDFASTVSLHAKDGVSMNPVTYTKVATEGSGTPNTSGFYKGTKGGTEFTTATNETDYLHYRIILALSSLATGEGINNMVTMKVSNFTSNAEGSQYLLVDASTDGAKAGDTIKVNLLDVLSMRVESKLVSSSEASSYGITSTDVPDSSGSSPLTSINACYRYRAESETVKVKGTSGDSWSDNKADALTYYDNVYGHKSSTTRPEESARGYRTGDDAIKTLVSPTGTDNAEEANTIELFSVSGVEKAYVMCDIYFYIDGWDKQCFNAAGGLSLAEGNLNFELNPNK